MTRNDLQALLRLSTPCTKKHHNINRHPIVNKMEDNDWYFWGPFVWVRRVGRLLRPPSHQGEISFKHECPGWTKHLGFLTGPQVLCGDRPPGVLLWKVVLLSGDPVRIKALSVTSLGSIGSEVVKECQRSFGIRSVHRSLVQSSVLLACDIRGLMSKILQLYWFGVTLCRYAVMELPSSRDGGRVEGDLRAEMILCQICQGN